MRLGERGVKGSEVKEQGAERVVNALTSAQGNSEKQVLGGKESCTW